MRMKHEIRITKKAPEKYRRILFPYFPAFEEVSRILLLTASSLKFIETIITKYDVNFHTDGLQNVDSEEKT